MILRGNGDNFIHPKTKTPVKMYRIVAEQTFETKNGWVHEGDVGGFVQSEKNLSQTDSSWVFNTAKVFDDAMLVDSVLTGNSQAFNSAILTDTIVRDNARVHGNAMVTRCKIFGNCDVFGDAVEVNDTEMCNSTVICQNSKVRNSKLKNGARIFGHSKVNNSTLEDTAEVGGMAIVDNCNLSGRIFLKSGTHNNQTLTEDIELKLITNQDGPAEHFVRG